MWNCFNKPVSAAHRLVYSGWYLHRYKSIFLLDFLHLKDVFLSFPSPILHSQILKDTETHTIWKLLNIKNNRSLRSVELWFWDFEDFFVRKSWGCCPGMVVFTWSTVTNSLCLSIAHLYCFLSRKIICYYAIWVLFVFLQFTCFLFYYWKWN